MKQKAKEEIRQNPALLNVITPMGLEFKRNSLVIGEMEGKIYGIIKYPQTVSIGWLSKLTNITGAIVSLGFKTVDSAALLQAINRNVQLNRGLAEGARDALSKQRAIRAAENGERVLKELDQNSQTVGLLTTAVMPMATDEKSFKAVNRRTESVISMLMGRARGMATLQKQAFQHISPTFPANKTIESVSECMMPLSTFIGGLPFASSGYNDGSGYYFAQSAEGNLIIVDTWKRDKDRTNSNMVIMGESGVGKSTAIKHIALSEYMIGTKLVFLDPEREYRELCRNLGGDWINAGGGKGGMINPLQIRPVPRDEEDEKERLYEDDGNGMGDMALYMKNLEIFFSLYIPSLTDMQKAYLKKCLVELYNRFHIFWDTDVTQLRNEDFPLMEDLHLLITEKAASEKDGAIYNELSILLYDIAHGADSFLWNGHTSIKTHTNCVCLDTHDLQDTSLSVKRTQYFNILSYCWKEMSGNRKQRVMLICDEAYLMIDPNVPQSLVFLRNVEKRARKYEAAVAVISHSVVDFLDPQIKMYGQALLDQPSIKILMGTDGQNLLELKTLYSLTDAQTELLENKQRKHALMMIGATRMHGVFELPEYKLDYMGSAGGR